MEVKPNVTPSLHPSNIAAIDGYGDDTKGYVNAAVEALSTAYDSLGKIHEAKAAASKNPAFNEHQQVLVVADFAEKHQTFVAQKFDSAVASLTKGIDAMDAMLNDPVKANAERSSVAAEIRAHIKGLTYEQRQKFLSDAHDAGDTETLRAVLGAPGFLSGITEVERQVRTRLMHEKNSPETANRLKVMRAARDMLLQRGGWCLARWRKRWARTGARCSISANVKALLRMPSSSTANPVDPLQIRGNQDGSN